MTKLRIAMKELKTHLQVASERGRNQKKRLLTKMISADKDDLSFCAIYIYIIIYICIRPTCVYHSIHI